MSDTSKYAQWYVQSDYDMETAEYMLNSGRNIYCIFMCHLSLEKALKGLYIKRTADFPAKTHNLIFFVDKNELVLSDDDLEFLTIINSLSVPTRYPEDLERMMKDYTNNRTKQILSQAKTIQQWIKQQ